VSESEQARVREIADTFAQLANLAGPAARPLIARLEDLYGAQMIDVEQRVLRIAGATLIEQGLNEVWDQIYAATAQDPDIQPGDARRLLFAEVEP
jgi:hypothetical protein